MGSFLSTPTYKLFERGLNVRAIQRFRGINAYKPLTSLGPEHAQDLLNVIVGGNGQLSKMRVPQSLSPAVLGNVSGPQRIFDFQQQNGTRQVVGAFAEAINYWIWNAAGTQLQFSAAGDVVVNPAPQFSSPWSFVTVQNILIGANGQVVMKWTGTDFLGVGLPTPAVAPQVTLFGVAGNLNPTFGYEWAFAWKSSGASPALQGPSPVEVSTASPNSPQFGGGDANAQFQLVVQFPPVPVPPDFDTIVGFRTVDGGGDLFRAVEWNVNTGAITFNAAHFQIQGAAPFLTIVDNCPDANLDQTTRAPFLNSQPPVGKYLAVGQGRVVVMNLVGNPQMAAYSGYERILIGNPPECFPPNNRLLLSIGAESIAGGGIIQAGLVMFSDTDRMYMLRGQMEDITDTAPIVFTQYLIELPWKIGCFSHETIRATPYGLLWLGADKRVRLFDGHDQPVDISIPVYPILRNITPGAEANCIASYFNWLDRDWYVLLVPYNGSVTPNRIIFWSVWNNPETGSQEIDIFISNIPCDSIATITTPALQRQLVIGANGQLYTVPAATDTTGGIGDETVYPPQAGKQLNAYWRSGYFGNDTPYRAEMWRWARLVADHGGFQGQVRLVDDDERPVTAPEILGPFQWVNRLSINRKAKRCSVEIDFPAADASVNVLELQVASMPSADK